MPFIERDKKFEEFLVDRNRMPFNGIASALNIDKFLLEIIYFLFTIRHI